MGFPVKLCLPEEVVLTPRSEDKERDKGINEYPRQETKRVLLQSHLEKRKAAFVLNLVLVGKGALPSENSFSKNHLRLELSILHSHF